VLGRAPGPAHRRTIPQIAWIPGAGLHEAHARVTHQVTGASHLTLPNGTTMNIGFKTRALKEAIEDPAMRRRHYGADQARKILVRLEELRAAPTLADFWPPLSPPPRCHLLTGDLAGTFSVDVKQPYRLLFVPVEVEERSHFPNDREWWNAIRSIEIVGIENTHG
jgi:plasmid maintenance system killer protein